MRELQILRNLRYLARVTIEFETAFIIGGGRDLFFDDTFVADANGLPAIPGSSLAGLLRHAWQDAKLGNSDKLFGHQDHGSPLEISWGCIHDKENKPVEGIHFDLTKISDDEVLSEALTMAGRDHVRINDKGTAAKGGKFDERSVSAGHRFTFELQLTANSEESNLWTPLLKLLTSGALRLGGKTRRGYGAFKVISLKERYFNLSTDKDFADYLDQPISLAEPSKLLETVSTTVTGNAGNLPTGTTLATVALKPEGFWMFGGGWGEAADMNPIKTNRISWDDNNVGKVKKQIALIPGSSIKGALAHRTAFYYNLEQKRFAKKIYTPEEKKPLTGAENEAVQALFGAKKEKGAGQSGQRGRVIISDIFIEEEQTTKIINHVSIDRFTGGARSGALFSEEPFFGGNGFTLKVLITEADAIKPYRKAFEQSLDDLVTGLLPLGGGVNRGNGYFTGKVKWSDETEQMEVTHG